MDTVSIALTRDKHYVQLRRVHVPNLGQFALRNCDSGLFKKCLAISARKLKLIVRVVQLIYRVHRVWFRSALYELSGVLIITGIVKFGCVI